jgi:hypothetical protein
MYLTRNLIAWLLAWPVMVMVDVVFLGLAGLVFHAWWVPDMEAARPGLEVDAYATMLVGWGVLLEAREVAVLRCRNYVCPHEGLDRALNVTCSRFGLGIISLGLVMESLIGLGSDYTRGLLSEVVRQRALDLLWIPFALSIGELCVHVFHVLKLRYAPSTRAGVLETALPSHAQE